MQRFHTVIVLQTEGTAPVTGGVPAWEIGDRILLPVTDDPALFCGQIYPAIYRFLARHGFVPSPFFPDLVYQALFDYGVIRTEGDEALVRVLNDEGRLAGDLLEAGRALFREEGAISDIRALLDRALPVADHIIWPEDNSGFSHASSVKSHLERFGGHTLAGYVITVTEENGKTGPGPLLDFVRSVAARPSGRAEPDPALLRDLERPVKENEQLLRAITGDYEWRAMPFPPGAHGQVVDLWPARHLLLYDQDELAYRSPEAFRALVMEALYIHWFGPKPPDTKENTWFSRLVREVTGQRAVKRGILLHPGAARWFDRFYHEEYRLVNRVADRSRINRLPPPDQYLEAVRHGGRVGIACTDIRDDLVKHALEVTEDARNAVADLLITEDECLGIVRERIWPVFETLCRPGGDAFKGSAAPARSGRDASAQLTPRGTAPRDDIPVPSPHQPVGATTGRSIAGTGSRDLHDDRLSIPGGFPGGRNDSQEPIARSAGAGGNRSARGNGPSGDRRRIIRNFRDSR